MNDCSRAFSVRSQEEMCSRKILVIWLNKEGVLYNTARADLQKNISYKQQNFSDSRLYMS
jgi:hypothetical protein